MHSMVSKFIYKFIGILGILMLLFSCQTNDTSDDIIQSFIDENRSIPNTDGNNIGGTLTENLTLSQGTFILNEALIVPEGITLTLDPGVIIKANQGADVFVAITQGGRINANGTVDNPIVFTSNNPSPAPGDWGGLIILGRAPINSVPGGDATSTSEIGGLSYGGSNAEDNSGILRYVRVEYSGGSASASSENNAFTLYAVGSGTTIEFIQAFEGLDDGIEFFGGTVNANYLSMIGAQDDSVDWTEGFSGTLTDVYIEHRGQHDRGIEGDGFNIDIGNNSSSGFFSNPTITNLSIIGLGSDTQNGAIRIRAGTRVTFNNVFLQGYTEGFDLDGDLGNSPTGQGVIDDITNANGVGFDDVSLIFRNDTGFDFGQEDFINNLNLGTGTDYDTWRIGWTRE